MQGLELKIPPPAVALLAACLMWLLSTVLPFGFEIPARSPAAVLIAMLGVSISIAGVIAFARAKTTVNPMRVEAASSLVSSGIFARTRNPMYLGLLVMLLAWSVWLANVAALPVLPLFVAYINRFQIAPEERALKEIFGEAYSAYMTSTRRWL